MTQETPSDTEYVKMIDQAAIYEVAEKTRLEEATKLSAKAGVRVLLKREDTQPVFSFKIRGAANKIFSLDTDQIENGVICSSAGNHAQGVALAASKRNIPAHIVMPNSTPSIKVEAVETLGGTVTLHGDHYDDAQSQAYKIAKEKGLTFIHPFDDPHVIAGQGTIGKEIYEQTKQKIESVFIPIGGGGLAAGIAVYLKSMNPEIKIYGVEPKDAAGMQAALANGEPTPLADVGVFADGVAVKKVGNETYRLCAQYLDAIITVTTDEICAGIQDIFEDTRCIVEPAGALAVAGIRKFFRENQTEITNAVAINCGANMNFDRLRHVSERASLGSGKESLFALEIPEEKGSFLKFCKALGKRNITEFNYRWSNPKRAKIFVGVETNGTTEDRHSIKKDLLQIETKTAHNVIDLTNNEVAKLHMRYLSAGTGSGDLQNERLYRFEFPERRGALYDFLETIGNNWNISLFHYRNHGSDYGRVLVAIQVSPETATAFQTHLDNLGYRYWDETDNEACKIFLD